MIVMITILLYIYIYMYIYMCIYIYIYIYIYMVGTIAIISVASIAGTYAKTAGSPKPCWGERIYV